MNEERRRGLIVIDETGNGIGGGGLSLFLSFSRSISYSAEGAYLSGYNEIENGEWSMQYECG